MVQLLRSQATILQHCASCGYEVGTPNADAMEHLQKLQQLQLKILQLLALLAFHIFHLILSVPMLRETILCVTNETAE